MASALTLLRQGGSKVIQGNLITLPVGGGLLYFEPVYVSQSAIGSSGCLSHAAGHARVLRTARWGTSRRCRRRWPKVFGTAPATASTGQARRPPRRRGQRQRDRAEVPAAGRELLQPGAGGAARATNLALYGSDLALMKTALDNATAAGAGQSARPPPCRRRHRRPAHSLPAGARRGSAGPLQAAGSGSVWPIRAAASPHGHAAAREGVRSVLTGHPEQSSPAGGCAAPAGLARGAGPVVAPRVLVDATAVPADRGALGRYVDGLVSALGAGRSRSGRGLPARRRGAVRAAGAERADRGRPAGHRAPARQAGLGAERPAAGGTAGRARTSSTRRITRCRCGPAHRSW